MRASWWIRGLEGRANPTRLVRTPRRKGDTDDRGHPQRGDLLRADVDRARVAGENEGGPVEGMGERLVQLALLLGVTFPLQR